MKYMEAPNWDELPALELSGLPILVEGAAPFSGPAVHLPTTAGDLLIQLSEVGVRIASVKQRAAVFDYGLLQSVPEPSKLELEQDPHITRIRAGDLEVAIEHEPFALSFKLEGQERLTTTTDGHFVRRFRVPPLAHNEHGWWFSLALQSGEPIYGLGEKWGALNKRGELLRSFNHDALGVNAERSYKNTPFAWSPEGWGLFCHTSSPVTHAVGCSSWSQRSYCALIEDSSLDIFLLVSRGDNAGADILSYYSMITGHAPIPPRWSNGVILSKAYYKTADEILQAAREVREKQMPCDVITFDGRAWQDTDTRFAFEWDASRYPDPGKVIDELKAMDFKICVWEYPLISTQHAWFKEFAERGWLLMDSRTNLPAEYEWDRGPFGEVLTPLPTSGIVDFTHPEAYEFWCEAHKDLFDLGVDMIKADFGEQLEDHMVAQNGESGHELHNVYAFLYNRCVFEAAERYSQTGSFLFSRAAWSGSQRFNSQWGGDPQADWEGMISNIRGGLSWGLSGAPFYATDVGGFYKDTRDDTLYVRWAQAGIFSAHFRLHGIGPREPWSYSAAAERAVMQALTLRYRLLAYLERAELQASETGLPVQRPMVLAFPSDRASWAFENQFMFGDDLLVVPCFSAAGDVSFYLPEGEWCHFDPQQANPISGCFAGNTVHSLTLELDQMAVFVKQDAQIPLSKATQYIDDRDTRTEIELVWSPTMEN